MCHDMFNLVLILLIKFKVYSNAEIKYRCLYFGNITLDSMECLTITTDQ